MTGGVRNAALSGIAAIAGVGDTDYAEDYRRARDKIVDRDAYGYAALAGWFGFAIVGKSYKILPFLNWLHRYSRVAGQRPVPLLRELVDERLAWSSFSLLLAGFVGVLSGLLTGNVAVVRGGGIVYAAGALVFALNAARLVLPLALGRQGTVLMADATA